MKSCESYRLEEVFKFLEINEIIVGPVGYGSYSALSVYSDPNLYYSKFRDMADVAVMIMVYLILIGDVVLNDGNGNGDISEKVPVFINDGDEFI
ncbi:hypothetical protein Tco_0511286 [Tanacetum coccineum]